MDAFEGKFSTNKTAKRNRIAARPQQLNSNLSESIGSEFNDGKSVTNKMKGTKPSRINSGKNRIEFPHVGSHPNISSRNGNPFTHK